MFSIFHRTVLFAVIAGVAAGLTPVQASAQSDILLRLRSGSPPGDRFRVDSAGGVVAIGELGIGIIPASGPGYRMMWYPFKAAFRAGGTDDGGAGTYWDDANIGFYSWAGGAWTTAKGYASFSFGEQNLVEGVHGTSFGSDNTCSGSYCVAIGDENIASGRRSTALGFKASTAGFLGSFVVADSSANTTTAATAANQFTGRFAGGWRFFTNSAMTLGVQFAAGATTPTALSDRNAKTGFRDLDNEDILRRIRSVPVSIWSYKEDPRATLHIGPMAQDFQKAFQLNDDDKGINMGDLDGVNLAGVRALEARTRKMQAELAERDKEIDDLKARLARLEAIISKK